MTTPAKPFGPVMQVAYVVDDLAAAIDYWTEVVGVGPFLVLDQLVFENATYLGAPLELHMSAAMAFSGGLQVELIYQHDATPTIFTERRGTGVHHLAAFTEDIDASIAYLQEKGAQVLQRADVPGGNRVAYLDTGNNGAILELAQMSAPVHAMFDQLKTAGLNWDGKQKTMSLAL